MSSDNSVYDIIFAGGGTAACITASRLSKADPSLRILILESGPHTKEKIDHIQPARYFRNLVLPAPTFTLHESLPSKALNDRSVVVPAGRCLGGGSSVNFTMFTRASASDYDDWETVHGNSEWGSQKLIPLLRKAETYQEPGGDPKIHGTSGPIKVSYTTEENNVGKQFLEVAAKWDKERLYTDDTTDFYTCNAYGRWPLFVDKTTGRRSDVPHNYIYNESFPNLEIRPNRRVLRVIFEGTRAVGVEHIDDIEGRTKGNPKPETVKASRLIVVSAGAFGSPAILERSGIGSRSILEKYGIKQIVDLPGVGENYMDHNVLFVPYIASADADTLDTIFRGREEEFQALSTKWDGNGKGLLAHNALDAGIRIRPNSNDLKTIPEFEERWKSYFANALDKPIMWIGTLASYAGRDPSAGNRKYYSLVYFTGYPASTGRVHIQSADAYAPLEFHPGYLDKKEDVAVLRWAYKHSREMARRMASYCGEFAVGHPKFPQGSEAALNDNAKPVDAGAPNIRYSAEDDKAIDDYHRENVATSWHSCGTCGMKAREKGGVVDSKLNVYGVQGLKVADCSIMPANVGANTYNTALAIGEKAAVIIARDLGISGVTEE